jgi:hypothetical protein
VAKQGRIAGSGGGVKRKRRTIAARRGGLGFVDRGFKAIKRFQLWEPPHWQYLRSNGAKSSLTQA